MKDILEEELEYDLSFLELVKAILLYPNDTIAYIYRTSFSKCFLGIFLVAGVLSNYIQFQHSVLIEEKISGFMALFVFSLAMLFSLSLTLVQALLNYLFCRIAGGKEKFKTFFIVGSYVNIPTIIALFPLVVFNELIQLGYLEQDAYFSLLNIIYYIGVIFSIVLIIKVGRIVMKISYWKSFISFMLSLIPIMLLIWKLDIINLMVTALA